MKFLTTFLEMRIKHSILIDEICESAQASFAANLLIHLTLSMNWTSLTKFHERKTFIEENKAKFLTISFCRNFQFPLSKFLKAIFNSAFSNYLWNLNSPTTMEQSTQCEQILSKIQLSAQNSNEVNSRQVITSKASRPAVSCKNQRRSLLKRPSSLGNVFRCFIGCFCTKSTNANKEDLTTTCRLDENIEDTLRMVEEESKKKKCQS